MFATTRAVELLLSQVDWAAARNGKRQGASLTPPSESSSPGLMSAAFSPLASTGATLARRDPRSSEVSLRAVLLRVVRAVAWSSLIACCAWPYSIKMTARKL